MINVPKSILFYRPDPIETGAEKIFAQPQSCPALKCNFQSKSSLEMKDHQWQEHYRRPYQCETCGVAFTKAFNLKKHVDSVHLGVRGHMCDKCGQGFYKRAAMLKHQKLNCTSQSSGPPKKEQKIKKSYDCPDCNKTYTDPDRLAYHRTRTHLNVLSKFNCDLCGSNFHKLNSYKHHLAVNHGIMPTNNICEICGVDCETFLEWRLHVSQHYSGGIESARLQNLKNLHDEYTNDDTKSEVESISVPVNETDIDQMVVFQ